MSGVEYDPGAGRPPFVLEEPVLRASVANVATLLGFLKDWQASDHGFTATLGPAAEEPLALLLAMGPIGELSFLPLPERMAEVMQTGPGTHFLMTEAGTLNEDFLTAPVPG